MPRVKATKKQVETAPSKMLSEIETTADQSAANAKGSTNGIDQNDAEATVTKTKGVRGKKPTTVGTSKDAEEEGMQKKPAARGKKKAESTAQNGVQDSEVKPKGRAKKTPAPVLEPEQEPSLAAKKKKEIGPQNGDKEVQVKPKGRAKKTPAQALETEQEPATASKASKPRAKKEKTPTLEVADSPSVSLNEIQPVDPAPVKARGRAKKEKTPAIEEPFPKEVKSRGRKKVNEVVPETKPTQVPNRRNNKKEVSPSAEPPKRSRGIKRLADDDIADVLEEDEEIEAEPIKEAVPKKRTKKEIAAAATSESKSRDKKKAKDEMEVEQEEQVPTTSTKRGSKKAPAKSKSNEQKQDLIEPVQETKTARGRKRVAPVSAEPIEDEAGEDSGSKSMLAEVEPPGCGGAVLKSLHNVLNFCFPAAAKANNKKEKKVETNGSMDKAYFTSPAAEFNLKISSWNVAGLRAWLKKDGLSFVDNEEPDIFCLQETKCSNEQLPEEMIRLSGYHPYWLCMPGGYAGVAIYSKIMPINVEYGIGNNEFDDVGRMITAEYEKFFLINVYVPNSGRKLVNLEPRMRWEVLFQEYVQKLDSLKPVVICGDMNVSHLEIDLANPKSNTRNAGFTKEERDKMSELLDLGYVDTFRHLYPDRKGAYTFWTYMANARARNVGWRLDYCIVSQRFVSRIVDQVFRSQCQGSDHCPITVFLNI